MTEQLVWYLDQQVRQYWKDHPSVHNIVNANANANANADADADEQKKEKELVDECLLVIQLMNNRDGLELLLRKCFYQHMIDCKR